MSHARRSQFLLFAALLVAAAPAVFSASVAGQWKNSVGRPIRNETLGNIYGSSKRFEGSSNLVDMRYHNGPLLTADITVHIIWYGNWNESDKRIIVAFLNSFSHDTDAASHSPSVVQWWRTVTRYTDRTGTNITRTINVGSQVDDAYSQGKSLTKASIQSVIKSALTNAHGPLPVDPKGGVYLVLTAPDVTVQYFCAGSCGFHGFTSPSIVGNQLIYAWVGNSGTQCPGTCAYPFAVPLFLEGSGAFTPLTPPNGNAAVDGMIDIIGHELAESASDPLLTGWFAGNEPNSETEIADLCEGIYGTGGGGSYTGQLLKDAGGASFNLNGVDGHKFLVQWLWSPLLNACFGPNAIDQPVL